MIIYINDLEKFKAKALQWASGFDVCCYLDSNNFKDRYSKFDCLLAAGVKDELIADPGDAFARLAAFRREHRGWMTGFLGYDLKNEIENVTSGNPDRLGFPDLYFFVPQHIIVIYGNEVEVISNDAQYIIDVINSQSVQPEAVDAKFGIRSRFTKGGYIEAVEKIKKHINRGDIYVTNFCQEFFAENADIDPLSVFQKLNELSPNPFASFFKLRDKYILCATPERFLAKRGNKLVSQPIKGTARRGRSVADDKQIIEELRSHTKELQENVMVVDMVRNDLTKSAKAGTVFTEELYGIYSFKHVHQMISTVVCELRDDVGDVEAIKNTFPMGSMTGAPKVSAMQLMEQYEQSRRGGYSGALGYFSPDGDFDFNVVIRTLLYNETDNYLSFQAGSAITYHADAQQEYEECLLKAQAIFEVLGQPQSSPQSAHL